MSITPERLAEIQARARQVQQSMANPQAQVSPERIQQIKARAMQLQQQQPTEQTQPQQPGFGQSLVQGIAGSFLKPIASAAGAFQAVKGLGTAAVQHAFNRDDLARQTLEESLQKATAERDFGYFGKARPLVVNQQTGQMETPLNQLKNTAGGALDLASYFALGAGAVSKAKGLLPLVKTSAKSGAVMGGSAFAGKELQQPEATVGSVLGETAKGIGFGAATSALFPLAGKAMSETKNVLGGIARNIVPKNVQNASARLIDSVIKPLEKEFRFNRDPGKTVVQEGIIANNRDEFLQKISQRKQEVGTEIGTKLDLPENAAKQIDLRPIYESIDQDIMEAVNRGNQTYVNRLIELKNGLTQEFSLVDGAVVPKKDLAGKVIEKPLVVSPRDAQRIKSKVLGEDIKWHGMPYDNEINQVKVRLYRLIDKEIDNTIQGMDVLNDRYGGLLSAEKSLERTINIGKRQQGISMGDIVSGSIGGIALGSPVGAISASLLRRFVESTPFKTRLAQVLRKSGIEEQAEKLLTSPTAEQDAILKALPVVDRTKAKKIIQQAQKALQVSLIQGMNSTPKTPQISTQGQDAL